MIQDMAQSPKASPKPASTKGTISAPMASLNERMTAGFRKPNAQFEARDHRTIRRGHPGRPFAELQISTARPSTTTTVADPASENDEEEPLASFAGDKTFEE